MSAFKNQNMPGVRRIHSGQVFIVKKNIKEMQPRKQIVEERKAAEAKAKGVQAPPPAAT